MKTILQTIGPLYGDDANGSVFGQPNGSVYTPPINRVITLESNANRLFVKNGPQAVCCTDSSGSVDNGIVAWVGFEIQMPKFMYRAELSTSATFASLDSSSGPAYPSGKVALATFGANLSLTITPGTTYYARVAVYTPTLDFIVASEVFELVGV